MAKAKALLYYGRRVLMYGHMNTQNSRIDVVVTYIMLNKRWRATRFYGHLDTQKMHISWKFLECLNLQLSLFWIVFGDFNEITHIEEKCGWVERSVDQMLAFQNALDACNL